MAQKRSTEKEVVVSSGAVPARRKTATAARPRRAKAPEAAAPMAPEVPTAPAPAPYEPAYGEIAALAYAYWEARGCQGGNPDEDWARAESELRSRSASAATA